MVAQLCSDLDSNYAEVNNQLDKMGYNIGMRLIEDFFAKSGVPRCANLRETAETISKVRFWGLLSARSYHIQTFFKVAINPDLGWIQDFSQYHSYCYQLDCR